MLGNKNPRHAARHENPKQARSDPGFNFSGQLYFSLEL